MRVEAASGGVRKPSMQAMFDAHNAYRSQHCVPALTWSPELAASSQLWANRCTFEHDLRSGLRR